MNTQSEITNMDMLEERINAQGLNIIYVYQTGCSVCNVLYPKITKLDKEVSISRVNASVVPEIVGKLSVFTAPLVILFFNGKEIYREGKFIRLEELEHKINQVL